MGFGVWGLGFGVWGLGFGVWGLGSGVWGLGFGVWGLGFNLSTSYNANPIPSLKDRILGVPSARVRIDHLKDMFLTLDEASNRKPYGLNHKS